MFDRRLLLLLLAVTGCFRLTKDHPGEQHAPEKRSAPAWVSTPAFKLSETSTVVHIGAVGSEKIPARANEPCWVPNVLVDAAKNRAIAGLARALSMPAENEAAIATLKGAQIATSFFDGVDTVYMLAIWEPDASALAAGKLSSLPVLAVEGGTPLPQLRDQLLQRSKTDRALAGEDRCSCGDKERCQQDYTCEKRSGTKQCVCRGKNCPCTYRGCAAGETCGDGRCY